MEGVYQIILIFGCALVWIYTWKLLNWAYLKPKRLGAALMKQGFKGNSYKLVYGDFMEIGQLVMEARSKPINLDDDIKKRIFPFLIYTIHKYGTPCFFLISSIFKRSCYVTVYSLRPTLGVPVYHIWVFHFRSPGWNIP